MNDSVCSCLPPVLAKLLAAPVGWDSEYSLKYTVIQDLTYGIQTETTT
ncbi:MAG: hypothetical protein OXE96_05185 [Gemmatimonadetes bacterium]|nr:hypothetical protein [Gemmatimonadota bacterium]